MRTPKFTDSERFKLPYVRAAFSRAPGYLRRRFDKYAGKAWRIAPDGKPVGK